MSNDPTGSVKALKEVVVLRLDMRFFKPLCYSLWGKMSRLALGRFKHAREY